MGASLAASASTPNTKRLLSGDIAQFGQTPLSPPHIISCRRGEQERERGVEKTLGANIDR